METEKKRKIKKIVFSAPEKKEKWLVCIRFPTDIRIKLKIQSEKDYEGRGKQSSLIEDSVKYYLYTCSDINWANYQKDTDYAELIDDIYEGLNQSPLENATQAFFTQETKNKMSESHKNMKFSEDHKEKIRKSRFKYGCN